MSWDFALVFGFILWMNKARIKIKVFQDLEILDFPSVWQISLGNVDFSGSLKRWFFHVWVFFSSDWKNSFFFSKILKNFDFHALSFKAKNKHKVNVCWLRRKSSYISHNHVGSFCFQTSRVIQTCLWSWRPLCRFFQTHFDLRTGITNDFHESFVAIFFLKKKGR